MNPYTAGIDAGFKGMEAWQNPYSQDRSQCLAWYAGWCFGRQQKALAEVGR